MRNLYFVFILLISPFVISCASTSKAPEEKSQEAKTFEKIADKGIVYLYRPGRAYGAANQTQIKVNGMNAGGTGPGTFFRWELKPGKYNFSCSTAESSAVVEVEAKAGEHYFLRQDERVGVGSSRVTLVKVDEKTGMEAVKKCKLLISTYIPE